MLVRATARSSLLLFGAAYAASSLRRLWRTPATAWLMRQRRYLGLSFAASHALHLLAILALALVLGDAFEVDAVTLVFGGGAYVMIAAMAATSSDRAFAWLGARRWKLLHRVGAHWIFVIFAVSYLPRAAVESPLYALPAAFVVALLGLRVAAFLRARRPRTAPATS
jgi:DMSO/TMAO reductase YedYZ heme-binding membrane subunit